jgi:hypothetical protein
MVAGGGAIEIDGLLGVLLAMLDPPYALLEMRRERMQLHGARARSFPEGEGLNRLREGDRLGARRKHRRVLVERLGPADLVARARIRACRGAPSAGGRQQGEDHDCCPSVRHSPAGYHRAGIDAAKDEVR